MSGFPLYQTPSCRRKGPMNQGPFVRPSSCPSVFLSRRFLGIGSLVFSETRHGVRDPHVLLCMIEPDFFFNFCPKNWGNGPKMPPKQFFLIYWKIQSLIFFGIWSIKEVHIVCCILAQILYLEKIWFLRSVPKCSQPIGLQDF